MRYLLPFICCCLLTGLAAQTDFASEIPLILIDTEGREIADEDKVMARMRVIDNGEGNLNHPDDATSAYDGWVGIELRGSSSQTYPKKGYGLETREANGDDRDVSLLGFPEEEDWVLHGPYVDKSLIRNALLYRMAARSMAYAPRVRMVELILNDSYQGVYLFTERIKRGGERVDIAKLKDDDVAGDEVTGGYILKFDKLTGETDIANATIASNFVADTRREQATDIIFHYPKPNDLVPEQRAYITDWIHTFEATLMGDDWLDPLTGYARFIDLEALADMFIFTEISRNVDGYRISTYFHKQKDSDGGQLVMGPVWDYNLAFGNANYCDGGRIEGWQYEFSDLCPREDQQINPWWKRFLSDPAVQCIIRERYAALRNGSLSNEAFSELVGGLAGEVGEAAAARNFTRWPVLDQYLQPNHFVGVTYADEINYLTDWTLARMTWLDGQWLTPTAIAERSVSEITLSPNPALPNDGLRVAFADAPTGTSYAVHVLDVSGRRVAENPFVLYDETVMYPGLPTGIYYVMVIDGTGSLVGAKKWVVR